MDQVADPLMVAGAVADYELFGKIYAFANEQPKFILHHNLYWEDATLMTGVTGLYDRTEANGSPAKRYLEYVEAWGDRDPGKYPIPIWHGDALGAGQTYIWLYNRSGKTSRHLDLTNEMITLIFQGRKFSQLGTGYRDYWMLFWVDDLYMVPTFLAARGQAAGAYQIPNGKDARTISMEYAQAYTDILRDGQSGLFWHDRWNVGKYLWGRGNGWAVAAFYRILKVMESDPKYRADADWIDGLLVSMAKSLKDNRNTVGTWNTDIIARQTYWMPETSGSGLIVYMMANMIADGKLSPDYLPVVQKAWHFLKLSVSDDGRLMRVQPVGNKPVNIDFENNSESFGVGAFLLAATAMSRLSPEVLAQADQVECVRLSVSELTLSRDQASVSPDKLRGINPDFPEAYPKVQAVFPGKPLPKTRVDADGKQIIISGFPQNYRGNIYLFYEK